MDPEVRLPLLLDDEARVDPGALLEEVLEQVPDRPRLRAGVPPLSPAFHPRERGDACGLGGRLVVGDDRRVSSFLVFTEDPRDRDPGLGIIS